jgi:hypothetical protein
LLQPRRREFSKPPATGTGSLRKKATVSFVALAVVLLHKILCYKLKQIKLITIKL